MKKEEVPQDKSNLSKHNIRELCYATDDNGEYTTVLSEGWEPKAIALANSIQDIKERIAQAKEDVQSGKFSPVVYFMESNKMDLTTLAGYVGIWKWKVKRHFKPNVFNKLNNKILSKYAEVFDITIDQLKNFKG
jgi:predicted RNA-binding protein with PIN domain